MRFLPSSKLEYFLCELVSNSSLIQLALSQHFALAPLLSLPESTPAAGCYLLLHFSNIPWSGLSFTDNLSPLRSAACLDCSFVQRPQAFSCRTRYRRSDISPQVNILPCVVRLTICGVRGIWPKGSHANCQTSGVVIVQLDLNHTSSPSEAGLSTIASYNDIIPV